MVVLGQITAPFGIKGWVKIYSHTAQQASIFDFKQWHLQPLNKVIEIDEWRQQGKSLVAHIQGVDDRDTALIYSGNDIAVDAKQLPELESDEYYWHQLEGLSVYSSLDAENTESVKLGVISHLIETGANDVIVVNATKDSIDKRQRLIPWAPDSVVLNIDLEQQKMLVNWDSDF